MGFFQDLVNGLAGGFSEIMQCTKFTECFTNNVGAYAGMNETEKNAFILNALNDCGAATTPDTLLGEIYPIVEKEVNENNVNLSQPVAHGTCPAKCVKDRNTCGECLKARLEILEALNYAERPEQYRQSFDAAAQIPAPVSKKCSLCGAPISPSMSVCDYCGTPVTGGTAGETFGASTRFVPSSTMSPEQQAYELIYKYQQEELNSAYSPELKKVMTNIQCASSWPVCPTMPKAEMLRLTEQSINETMLLLKAKMSLSDLYSMADHYHMSVPTYLRGLFEGDPNLKTAVIFRKEQQEEREREIREETTQKNMELQRQAEERRKQSEQEFWERRRASYSPPQYGGGGGGGYSRCCGTCIHYMSGSNSCTENIHSPSSASDSCSLYRMR